MKMKLNQCTILLGSFLFIFVNNAYSDSTSDLIQLWQKNQDYLIFGVPVKFDQLNPTLSINAHTKLTLPLIFEPLVSIGAQQELQPILAKSWHISSDGKSILLNIKSKHFFSDNTEVTAQDVVNSISRVCAPGSQVAEELKGLSGCVSHSKGNNVNPGIHVIGKYELKFDINSNPTTFLYQLSSPSIVLTKQINNRLIGSGPYTLQENKSTYIILKKNQFASKDNSTINAGVIFFYANQKYVLSILKNNKPDGALMYRMDDLSDVNDLNYKLIKVDPNITEILVLNNQRFPFNKPIVRQALASAIYNNFKYSCMPGAHQAYGVIPYGTGGSIDNIPPKALPVISPEQVFKSVPELKNKQVIVTIHQLEDLKKECESEQIAKVAKEYNINIKFNYHKTYATLEPLYLNHKLDGFIELYVFRNREAYSTLQFFSTSGENNANIKNTTLDNMLKEAISAPSSHGRFQSYRNIAKYIQDESIVIPLFYMDHGNILSKCITGTSDNFIFNSFIHIPQLNRRANCTF